VRPGSFVARATGERGRVVDETAGAGQNTTGTPGDDAPAIDPAQLAAFAAMIAANHDEMARVAFIVSEGPGPAQDAVRSAWVRAWRALTSPTPPAVDRRRDWLLGLAAVEARHLIETGYRPGDDAPGGPGVAATQASAARAYRSDELELANALAALDGPDRMIVSLRYVGGLDAEAIARELSIPERAVLARIARVLKGLVGEDRLAGMPSATVADYEAALAERIRALTSRALVALDPEEVARAAIETGPETTLAEQLETWLRRLVDVSRRVDPRIALAVVGVFLFVLIVPRLLSGFTGGVGAAATPVPNDAKRLCAQDELGARVDGWQSNGGDWTASISVRNVSTSACLIDPLPEPWLVDRTRNALITGRDVASSAIRIGPGDELRTQVHVHDYCGAPPAQPVTIAFRDGTLTYVAQPGGDAASGIPACAGGSGSISMQAWAP